MPAAVQLSQNYLAPPVRLVDANGADVQINATRSPYLGMVATKCATPSDLQAGAAQINCRSAQIARDKLTSWQIRYANFYGAGDLAPGGPCSYRAAIEYPIGVFTPVYWSGVRDVVAPDGDYTAFSDAITVNIPRGALFFVRVFAQGAKGVPFRSTFVSAINGEQLESGASGLTDKTTGGTMGTTGANLPPASIVAMTKLPALGIIGDSQNAGQTTSVATWAGDLGMSAMSLGPFFAYVNMSILGEAASGFSATGKRADNLRFCSAVISNYGGIDVATSAAVAIANIGALATSLNKPFYQLTLLGQSTVPQGSNFTAPGNQTAKNIDYKSVNQRIRALNIPGVTDLFDPAARYSYGTVDSNIWKANEDGTALTEDGVHPNSKGYMLLQTLGVFDPLRFT